MSTSMPQVSVSHPSTTPRNQRFTSAQDSSSPSSSISSPSSATLHQTPLTQTTAPIPTPPKTTRRQLPTTTPLYASSSTPTPTPLASPQPRTMTRASCLLFALLLLAASSGLSPAHGFPRNRRHFFTTCWGWGASCSLYGRSSSNSGGARSVAASTGRSAQPVRAPSRASQARRTDPYDIAGVRTTGRLPSPFSSSNWGAGTMGKRDPQQQQQMFTDNRRRQTQQRRRGGRVGVAMNGGDGGRRRDFLKTLMVRGTRRLAMQD